MNITDMTDSYLADSIRTAQGAVLRLEMNGGQFSTQAGCEEHNQAASWLRELKKERARRVNLQHTKAMGDVLMGD